MIKNLFFKSTPLYKEYKILELIFFSNEITQRKISDKVGIAVSMVNNYLDKLENEGFIKRKYKTSKNVKYVVTKKGIERKNHLHINYLSATQKLYEDAKNDVELFLEKINKKGFYTILLYGAGEVAEILLNTIIKKKVSRVNVIAVIDDDFDKIGKELVYTPIIDKKDLNHYPHDGILISSFAHHKAILNELNRLKYPKEKILAFTN